MTWPTWDQAAVLAAVCIVTVLVLRTLRPSRWRAAAMPAALELALMSTLYSLWRLARELPLDQPGGAIERARRLNDFQRSLRMPTELSLQHFVLDHDWLARLTNQYYAVIHVPALLCFMVWMFVWHRPDYSRWRNALVVLTAFCLIVRFVRVAPPRFLPDLGYVDLATKYGMSLYGPVGTGVSDQFAAMPSIHVGWAAVVSFGIVAVDAGRWRWVFLAHVVLTELVVAATGNHWWMDGIVAVVFLGIALQLDTTVRRLLARRHVVTARPAA
jgi:hypothetical protein